jgi:glycopeptide antibiotics resistance protein
VWISNEVVLLLLVLALFVIVVVSLFKRRSFSKTLVSLVFASYVAVVVLIVLMPFPIKLMPGEPCLDIPVNLVPFANIIDAWRAHMGTDHQMYFFRLVLGNILLFVPLGFLAPVLWERVRKTRVAAMLFLAVPICIEFIQLINGWRIGSMYRSVDIDDVLLNFMGALAGFYVFRLLERIRVKRLNSKLCD